MSENAAGRCEDRARAALLRRGELLRLGRVLLEVERHLATQCRVSRSAFMLNGVFVHADGRASLEPASPALVAMGFVDDAAALGLGLAHVLTVASNRTLKNKIQSFKNANITI